MKRPDYIDYVTTVCPITGYQLSSGHIVHNEDLAHIGERLTGLVRAFEANKVSFDQANYEIGELLKELDDML